MLRRLFGRTNRLGCFLLFLGWFSVLTGPCLADGKAVESTAKPPNILFIAVDDLRPELGCYGRTHIASPNIDRLASQGVVFERAYCMVPTCGASRASLMTGVRPTRTRFVSYLTRADEDAPMAVPLHAHLKANGYTTLSLGKVFHHKTDHADGWSTPPWRSSKGGYQDAKAARQAIRENRARWPSKKKPRGLPFEAFEAEDHEYPDGECADTAIARLSEFAAQRDAPPFFMAVGFLKPHLPFVAPQRYWDLYDPGDIRLPDNYQLPRDVPKDAPHNSGELRAYAGIAPKGLVPPKTALKLMHGYYACVSFIDAQIGRVLDELESTGLAKDTIVVLWGDHGWQLGEHGMWNKHSCFETSLHTPLIMRLPDRFNTKPATRVSGLVEFIDIYPTLCELAGVELPTHLEGTSLVAQMSDPSRPGKAFAISRFQSGDTIRTSTFRYSEYTGKQGQPRGDMLFDHLRDPQEDVNIASQKKERAKELQQLLREHKGQ